MKKDLKKILAGIGAASLIGAGGLTLPGVASGSGWGADKSADSAEVKKGAVTESEEVAGQAIEDTAEKSAEEAVKKIIPPQKYGKCGWS